MAGIHCVQLVSHLWFFCATYSDEVQPSVGTSSSLYAGYGKNKQISVYLQLDTCRMLGRLRQSAPNMASAVLFRNLSPDCSLVSALCTQIPYLKKFKALIMQQGVPQRTVLELPCKCGHDLNSASHLDQAPCPPVRPRLERIVCLETALE